MKRLTLALLIGLGMAAQSLLPHSANAIDIDASKRAKVIDFEDEVVEGVNRRPLDSLSQISEADRRRKKPHLYRKRVGFSLENTESFRALRFTP